jgi:uncharacterized damage-inducible protein DinB
LLANSPEPWLRGTLIDVAPVQRAVLHALELAREDVEHWCATLTDEELNSRPAGLGSVAFHLRHIARSIDRLLTYAEAKQLDQQQLAALKSELESHSTRDQLLSEFTTALTDAAERVRAFSPEDFAQARAVGKKAMPTTVAGLLVHVADHTQRHVGQAITTCKIVMAQRT